MTKAAAGAVGLGAVASYFVFPGKVGLIVALSIVLLFVLCFGGYYYWRRWRERRSSRRFEAAVEAQTAAAPRTISDPIKRAELDRLRQKFLAGIAQFKKNNQDIYVLPWHLIIGESGSGKSEAIRHSGINFLPGMQDEMQGTGGTVNMDWWFTRDGIILDTAGAMVFPQAGAAETPEWKETLDLLRKYRKNAPINGLFLVLSVESLIKDSADAIARKANRLAQQLDKIQRTLDVRFPVYLLVTKCDLLTGFRAFFDSHDPEFQSQMFGWSNADPLDAPFRPELIKRHLEGVADRLRRRRLALLGDTAAGWFGNRDQVGELFALPESVLRLSDRLKRYLETLFVPGPFSPKPLFLRGIYFTSSMREGGALDEALALATGLPLDQLPQDSRWEKDKNRAFFLRDLFLEKVFPEQGLITRATNTLRMLRQRQLWIFGSAVVALLLLVAFATYGYFGLKASVLREAGYWQAGATNWTQGEWSSGLLRSGEGADHLHYTYSETNAVKAAPDAPTVVNFHSLLMKRIQEGFSVPWIFKPAVWVGMGEVRNRPEAQLALFEHGVLLPVLSATRRKMTDASQRLDDSGSLARHRDALLSLVQLEAELKNRKAGEGLSGGTNGLAHAEKYLNNFIGYLTDSAECKVSTNLATVFAWTYQGNRRGKGTWAPDYFSGGDRLSNNAAIRLGLDSFRNANRTNEMRAQQELESLNRLVAALLNYRVAERSWLPPSANACATLATDLAPRKSEVDEALNQLRTNANFAAGPLTNLNVRYTILEAAAQGASQISLREITAGLGETAKASGIVGEVLARLRSFGQEAAEAVRTNRAAATVVTELDYELIAPVQSRPAFETRWALYTNACALRELKPVVVIGDEWKQLLPLLTNVSAFTDGLTNYGGPLAPLVSVACGGIAGTTAKEITTRFISEYTNAAKEALDHVSGNKTWTLPDLTNARVLFERVQRDLGATNQLQLASQDAGRLHTVREDLDQSRTRVLVAAASFIHSRIGFPMVFSDNAPPMDLDGVKKLNALLVGLSDELNLPGWQDKSEALKSLQQDSARYASVFASLVGTNGNPIEWELLFIPGSNNDDNRKIITVYPYAQVTLGEVKGRPQRISLGKDPISLGKSTVDRQLEIAFQDYDPTPIKPVQKFPYPTDWGLLRLLRAVKCERLDDGRTWRFKLRLDDKSQSLTGDAEFEARLTTKLGLPKVEDWPR